MRIKKVLLISSPRYLRPFTNESDNFLLPLGLPCIAAAIREKLPHVEVRILDCLLFEIGWNCLKKYEVFSGFMRLRKPKLV